MLIGSIPKINCCVFGGPDKVSCQICVSLGEIWRAPSSVIKRFGITPRHMSIGSHVRIFSWRCASLMLMVAAMASSLCPQIWGTASTSQALVVSFLLSSF